MNLEKIRTGMDNQDLDCLILTEPSNFIYAIGEEASGYLFITQEKVEIIAPRFYLYQLNNYDTEYAFSKKEYGKKLDKKAEKIKGKVAADTESEKLKEKFGAEKTDIITKLRRQKTPEEIQKIAEACKITDNALKNLRKDLFDGLTEFQAVNRLNKYYCEQGVTEAFLTNKGQSLVQRNCLKPHRLPTTQKIQKDDLVIVDTGARKDFYCSDVTRTYCENPSEDQIKLFEAVKQIQKEEIEMIEPGRPIKEVKQRELEMVKELGYNPDKHVLYYSHCLGINVHEQPTLTHETEEKFQEGMIVTIEPGIHVPGLGGVRIEDTIAVTSKGGKRLSKAPKKL